MLSKYKTWDKTLLTFEFHLYLIFICCCFFFLSGLKDLRGFQECLFKCKEISHFLVDFTN